MLSTGEFFKRTAIFIAVALVPILVWLLFDVILIGMGAILIAVLLYIVAEPLEKWVRLPRGFALVVSGIVIVCVIGAAGYLFGSQTSAELHDVLQRVNDALASIRANLERSDFGQTILASVQNTSFSVTSVIAGVFTVSLAFITGLVVTIFAGIYLAAQVHLYRDGLIQLFPHAMRANAAETLKDIANALRLWLLGQLIGMVLIGLMSALATWLIGLPSPLALGLLAGLFEFIPYVGPIAGAIPAVLVATAQGFDTVLWTILAYTLIQQAEGHLIAPLISREMVYIPPVVLILGIVTITTLFGPVAIVFAAPIAVILFVAIKKLYIRDSLGDPTSLPGEPE